MWAEPDKKRSDFHYAMHNLEEKVIVQTNGTNGKHILRRGAFWEISPHQISNGETPNPKNAFQKFVSSILSDLEKFAEFNDEIVFHV